MVEFCADQLLVSSDLKRFHSCNSVLPDLEILITKSQFGDTFFPREEVNTDYPRFIRVKDRFDFCYLFHWVKCVTRIGFKD
jgi:hypothetical protein